MTTVLGGTVRPHAQAFADEVARRFKVSHISTYQGHQPAMDRALDIFPKDKANGDAVAQFFLDNQAHFGGLYVIWYQRIDSGDGRGWRGMADRGKPGMTQARRNTVNHYDHVHISFEPTGAAAPPSQGDDELTPDEKAALGRIDQRVANLEKAMADLHPELLTGVASLTAKVDELLKRP